MVLSMPVVIGIQTIRYLAGDGWQWIAASSLFGPLQTDNSLLLWLWNDLWLGFSVLVASFLVTVVFAYIDDKGGA